MSSRTTDDAAPIDTTPLHGFLSFEYGPPTDDSGTATVRMPVTDNALGVTGNLHGGAIATMVDLSCALAAVSARDFDPERQSMITVDMHVRYLGRPRTDTIVAAARVVRAGSQLIVVSCDVTDDEGHQVAVADFSMMVVTLRDPLPGHSAFGGPPAPSTPTKETRP